MFHIALFEPEIPPNTGNIIRLCANSGCHLHLVEPLGFTMEDKSLRRAGLDYAEFAEVKTYPNLQSLADTLKPERVLAITTKGDTTYTDVEFGVKDLLLFGPETRGLPDDVLAALPPGQKLRLPMVPGSRSMNLSNAVAVVLFEAWRQAGFTGGL